MLPALKRFFEAVGCRTQVELAEFLEIKQPSVSDAIKRERIPSDRLLTLWRKKGVNPDWILTGQGTKGLQPADFLKPIAPATVYIKEVRPPEECSVEELMAEVVRRVAKKAR